MEVYKAFGDAVFFEDYAVGDRFRTGSPTTFTEEDIVAFARQYDPQPFHIDREAAEGSIFGGFVAAGGHIFARGWGHLIASGFMAGRAMGAAGMNDVRWPRPVRPGDRIRVAAEVLETRASAKRADRGYVTFRVDMTNQDDDLVMTLTVPQIIARRPR